MCIVGSIPEKLPSLGEKKFIFFPPCQSAMLKKSGQGNFVGKSCKKCSSSCFGEETQSSQASMDIGQLDSNLCIRETKLNSVCETVFLTPLCLRLREVARINPHLIHMSCTILWQMTFYFFDCGILNRIEDVSKLNWNQTMCEILICWPHLPHVMWFPPTWNISLIDLHLRYWRSWDVVLSDIMWYRTLQFNHLDHK